MQQNAILQTYGWLNDHNFVVNKAQYSEKEFSVDFNALKNCLLTETGYLTIIYCNHHIYLCESRNELLHVDNDKLPFSLDENMN